MFVHKQTSLVDSGRENFPKVTQPLFLYRIYEGFKLLSCDVISVIVSLYNHTGNCNIDWIDNGRNESVPIADTESNSD